MQIEQMTNREIEIEQVKRKIAETDLELERIMREVIPNMIIKNSRRRAEVDRQEKIAAQERADAPTYA